MNRRDAVLGMIAVSVAGCVAHPVAVAASAVSVPTEAEIWANPTAHGIMPIEYIRNELMRLTADAWLIAAEARASDSAYSHWDGDVNGIATALRLMGVQDNIDAKWAARVRAELGRPMSHDACWITWPGNDAWKVRA